MRPSRCVDSGPKDGRASAGAGAGARRFTFTISQPQCCPALRTQRSRALGRTLPSLRRHRPQRADSSAAAAACRLAGSFTAAPVRAAIQPRSRRPARLSESVQLAGVRTSVCRRGIRGGGLQEAAAAAAEAAAAALRRSGRPAWRWGATRSRGRRWGTWVAATRPGSEASGETRGARSCESDRPNQLREQRRV